MALRWYYSPLIGSDIEITDRVNWPDIDISMSANGDVSSVTLIVDDPLGDFIPLMKRRIHANADAAPAGTQLVGNWFIEDIKVSRKGQTPVLAARSYALTMVDENSLLGRRKFVGADADRRLLGPETDIDLIRWALGTTELNTLSPDETYIDTSGPVNIDPTDWRTQGPDELMVSLRGASHKHFWVKYEEAALVGGAIVSSSVAAATVITTTTAHGLFTGMQVVIAGHSGSTPSLNGLHTITVTGTNTYTIPVTVTVGGTGGTTSTVGRYVLWYANMNTSSLYPSTISLSNVVTETLADPLVWELGKASTELDRDGSRMASGLVGPYKAGWEYVQDTAVGDAYTYVDQVAGDLKNVSTAAKAIAQITGQLAELRLPDDEITTTVTVGEANLNLIKHGMILPVHATHFPNYTDDSDPTARGYLQPGYATGFVNTRVMERTIRQVGAETFELPLKLSPMRAPLSCSTTVSGIIATDSLNQIQTPIIGTVGLTIPNVSGQPATLFGGVVIVQNGQSVGTTLTFGTGWTGAGDNSSLPSLHSIVGLAYQHVSSGDPTVFEASWVPAGGLEGVEYRIIGFSIPTASAAPVQVGTQSPLDSGGYCTLPGTPTPGNLFVLWKDNEDPGTGSPPSIVPNDPPWTVVASGNLMVPTDFEQRGQPGMFVRCVQEDETNVIYTGDNSFSHWAFLAEIALT